MTNFNDLQKRLGRWFMAVKYLWEEGANKSSKFEAAGRPRRAFITWNGQQQFGISADLGSTPLFHQFYREFQELNQPFSNMVNLENMEKKYFIWRPAQFKWLTGVVLDKGAE